MGFHKDEGQTDSHLLTHHEILTDFDKTLPSNSNGNSNGVQMKFRMRSLPMRSE